MRRHINALITLIAVGAATGAALTPAANATVVGRRHAQPCIRSFAPPPDSGGSPFGVTAGPGGTWYSDGSTINKIHNGHTTTYAVPGVEASDDVSVGWLTWDGANHVWFAARDDGRLGTITARGSIRTIQVPVGANGPAVPQGIVVHPGREVWFTDQQNNRIGELSLTTEQFQFFQVPSEFPLGLVQARDHDLYFTERSVDKVARLDPRTGLFTEWQLPTGAFPNRLAATPDGSVWFTALNGGFLGRIKDGLLSMYPISGGPVGLTYYAGRLWAALFNSGELAEISLHGTVVRTWAIPDSPLQVAASHGELWLTGNDVWSVNPHC